MLCSEFIEFRLRVSRRVVCASLSCLMAASTWSASAQARAVHRAPAAGVHSPAATALKPDPEVLLIEVYKALAANHLSKAMEKADKLVEAYPTFRLGQLIRGDLLLMHTQPVTTFGPAKGPKDRLENLREEAMVRLKSLRERPDPAMLPRQVLQLRDDQKHVLVVDAARSRLYLYANEHGQLKLLNDYYISQGKSGVNKLKEGDQKTPVGVYYITSHLSGKRLPDFYGSGALPINYPNEWDRINGRSGSGIWLHGTPSDSYSRPPLSSDGCVVLTNPDLYKVVNSVEIGKTPVVIAEHIDFVSKAKWNGDRRLAEGLVEGWRRDVESLDLARVMSHYSRNFRSDQGEDLKDWLASREKSLTGVKSLAIQLRDVTHFFYPGRDDMIVSTFTQQTRIGRSTTSIRKRQYWIREGDRWHIIYELNI